MGALRPIARRYARAVLVGACLLLIAVQLGRSLALAGDFHAEGIEYAARGWQQSGALVLLSRTPQGTPIYTNAPDLVYIRADRVARWLPLMSFHHLAVDVGRLLYVVGYDDLRPLAVLSGVTLLALTLLVFRVHAAAAEER